MVQDEQTDDSLIRRFQRGDEQAFASFVGRHQDRIFRLCASFLRPGADPADATQEVFLRAYTGLNRFRFGAKPFTWLYRTAKNVCKEFNRKVKAVPDTSPELEDPRSLDASLHAIDSSRLVNQLLRGLPERQQDVVLLRVFEGFSVEETARAMGVRPGTIKAHLHKAMLGLRGQLKEMKIEGKDYA